MEEIDRLNIFHASLLAMEKAVAGLQVRPEQILIDGKFVPPNLSATQAEVSVEAIIKGDAKVPAIGAASIIAKVYRDRMMAVSYTHLTLPTIYSV